MNYIMLDIDEVLVDDYAKTFLSYNLFNPTAVRWLSQLHRKTGARIVITSTWRKICPREEILEAFLVADPDFPLKALYSCTPSSNTGFRGHEVDYWLKENAEEGDRFVIIDDSTDYTRAQLPHMMWIRTQVGITAAHYDFALNYFQTGILQEDEWVRPYLRMNPPEDMMIREPVTTEFWYGDNQRWRCSL